MFRHRGQHRTAAHNLKIASLLSFVAGTVNVAGFFAVGRLTTNVTGHFAFFADELLKKDFADAFMFFLYVFSFLFGAFISSLSIELVSRWKSRYNNLLPIFLEISILLFVAVSSDTFLRSHGTWIACSLLFSMGMQNALVTNISNSIVRTTHLTGLFTDLGIELSQLFFYKSKRRTKLKSSIRLRMAIILSFFLGCIIGGLGYFHFKTKILFLAIFILLAGLFYDMIKFKITSLAKKYIS